MNISIVLPAAIAVIILGIALRTGGLRRAGLALIGLGCAFALFVVIVLVLFGFSNM